MLKIYIVSGFSHSKNNTFYFPDVRYPPCTRTIFFISGHPYMHHIQKNSSSSIHYFQMQYTPTIHYFNKSPDHPRDTFITGTALFKVLKKYLTHQMP